MLLLLLFTVPAFSQDKIAAIKTGHFYATADAYAGFDAFGFQYFIKDNTFIKTNGKDKLEYKKIALGKITRADIRNPLLIVLFYEEFNTAILIDNQLNEVREIKFNDLPTPVVAHAAGLASQNRLWVFDSLTQQLMLFDYLKNTLTPLATPLKENIMHYQSDFNYFQWTDVKGDWYACDIFGKVTLLGKVPKNDDIYFVSGNAFLFTSDGKLSYRDVKTGQTQTVFGLDNSVKKFYYQGQILAIFTSSGITNYKTDLP
jgi:hypothetical protein